MLVPRCLLGMLLACALTLGAALAPSGNKAAGNLQAGERPARERPAGDEPAKPDSPPKKGAPETLTGQAKISTHSYKMKAGEAYRITVKTETFAPQVWIDGQRAFDPNFTSPFINPAVAQPNKNPAPKREAQIIFAPPETKEYKIQVDFAPGTEIPPGENGYMLTIEQAAFKPQAAFKEPQLPLADHAKKLEQGKAYGITITGQGVAPEVQILDGDRPVLTWTAGRWFGFGPDAEYASTFTFVPPRTTEYRILVALGPVTEKRTSPPKYTATIAELKVELSVNEQLTNQDPIYETRGGRHKVHSVKLQANKTYQIDMMSRAFDAYLFVEDSAGNVVAEDDDSGGNLNARIVFRPKKADTYKVVATTFERAAPDRSPGAYTLTVVDNPSAVAPPPQLGKGLQPKN